MRKILVVPVLCLSLFGLASCSPSPSPDEPIVYTDANLDVMKEDIRETVCAVSGKQVMTEEDVESFLGLAERLDGYEGNVEDKVDRVATIIEDIALTWGNTLGLDLGEQNGAQLTALCEQIESAL